MCIKFITIYCPTKILQNKHVLWWNREKISRFINPNFGLIDISWSCGLMDKASDFGSEDCRFESCHDRYHFASYSKAHPLYTTLEFICKKQAFGKASSIWNLALWNFYFAIYNSAVKEKRVQVHMSLASSFHYVRCAPSDERNANYIETTSHCAVQRRKKCEYWVNFPPLLRI